MIYFDTPTMSVIADKPTKLSSDKIETIEKEVSEAKNITTEQHRNTWNFLLRII